MRVLNCLLEVIFEEEDLLLAVFVVAISCRPLILHPDNEINILLDILISTMANLCLNALWIRQVLGVHPFRTILFLLKVICDVKFLTLIQKTKLRQISICANSDLSMPIPACFRILLKPFSWNLLKIRIS